MKRLTVGLATSVLVSGGLGLAGLGAGTAQALTGPFRWCPGQSLWISGNHVTNPVVWDNSVCHTYYMVDFGQGNVAQTFGTDLIHQRRRLLRRLRLALISAQSPHGVRDAQPMHSYPDQIDVPPHGSSRGIPTCVRRVGAVIPRGFLLVPASVSLQYPRVLQILGRR
jgi:hypothetical protein